MKTERRHELQENELAGWLGKKLSDLQPYAKTILGVAFVLLLALAISSYVRGRNDRREQAAWAAYFDATATADPAKFEEVAYNFAGNQAAGWSLQTAGDLLLNQGIGKLFQDREQAQEQLQAAQQAYQAVLDSYQDPMLQQRAMLGLAKSLETQGEFAAAEETYHTLMKRWPESEMAEVAEDRLAQVTSPQTQQWYDWFAQQEPPQSPLNEPGLFQDLPNLPDQPDLTMPQPGQLLGGQETSDDGDQLPPGVIDLDNSLIPSRPATNPPAATDSPAATDPGAAGELPDATLPGDGLPTTSDDPGLLDDLPLTPPVEQ